MFHRLVGILVHVVVSESEFEWLWACTDLHFTFTMLTIYITNTPAYNGKPLLRMVSPKQKNVLARMWCEFKCGWGPEKNPYQKECYVNIDKVASPESVTISLYFNSEYRCLLQFISINFFCSMTPNMYNSDYNPYNVLFHNESCVEKK